MRWVLDMVCRAAHHLWWIPVWNGVHFLTCPIGWACSKFPSFERWYWDE